MLRRRGRGRRPTEAVVALVAACVIGAFASGPAGAGIAGVDQVSLGTAGNGAHDAFAEVVSDDGSVSIFATAEQLAVTDLDTTRDLYARSAGQTTHVTDGPGTLGNAAIMAAPGSRISADGRRAFFTTAEKLAADDTDLNESDIYMRDLVSATTTLISKPEDPNADSAQSVTLGGISSDGGRVFFTTPEGLAGSDTDGTQIDIYVRDVAAATTALVTPPGNGGFGAFFAGATADGSRAFYTTLENLPPDNDGGFTDLYARDVAAATTTLISQGEPSLNDDFNLVNFALAFSADGGRVFFATGEELTSTDTDGTRPDVYMREGATTTQISLGAAGGNGAFDSPPTGFPVLASSADGRRLVFYSTERLEVTDTDNQSDLYMWDNGAMRQITLGNLDDAPSTLPNLVGITPDGQSVLFGTRESLEPGDTDASADLYTWRDNALTRLSVGSSGGNAPLDVDQGSAISIDGSRVFFRTQESLEPTDTDSDRYDIYLRENGVTTQVSRGGNGAFDVVNLLASRDGGAVVFDTRDQLASTDIDGFTDVYLATIDSTAPETTIDAGPASPTTSTDAAFSYSSSQAGSSFECSIDGGGFVPCEAGGTSFSGLAAGAHSFAVRSTDPAGNTDPTPAEYGWTIEAGRSPAARTCRGKPATVVGTERNDRIKGTKRKDVIVGLGGRDKVKAGKGNDIVCAGKGNDVVFGDDGNDKLLGEGGKDRLTGGDGRDLTNGGGGRDRCDGGRSKDTGRNCERGPEA